MSPAQADASRANGARSLGPLSEEGKIKSSRNSVSHGLFSSVQTILDSEDAASFLDFHELMFLDLKPATTLETVLVERIVTCASRLGRVTKIESLLLSTHKECLETVYSWNIDRLAKLNRYERSMERSMYQAMSALEAEKLKRPEADSDQIQARVDEIQESADFSARRMVEETALAEALHKQRFSAGRDDDENQDDAELKKNKATNLPDGESPAKTVKFLVDQIMDLNNKPRTIKSIWRPAFEVSVQDRSSDLHQIVDVARRTYSKLLGDPRFSDERVYNAIAGVQSARFYVKLNLLLEKEAATKLDI